MKPRACAYARLFDPPAPDPAPHPLLRGASSAPQPLVPIFPPPAFIQEPPVDSFRLGLRLLGQPHEGDGARLTAALKALAGADLGGKHGLVKNESVTESPTTERPALSHTRRVEIVFETPAWLGHDGRLMEDLEFRYFFRAIYRRLTTLCALYGELGADHQDEFARLDALAPNVRTLEKRLEPHRWKRLSKERDERHPMHGLLGSVTFEGDLAPFMPALRLAEVTHVGKATSFGLGRISVDAR